MCMRRFPKQVRQQRNVFLQLARLTRTNNIFYSWLSDVADGIQPPYEFLFQKTQRSNYFVNIYIKEGVKTYGYDVKYGTQIYFTWCLPVSKNSQIIDEFAGFFFLI